RQGSDGKLRMRLRHAIAILALVVGRPPRARAGPQASLCCHFLEVSEPARGPAAAQGGRPTGHHGQGRFGGPPVPGAAVTVTRGEQRFATITDQEGAYSFAELAEGVWTVRVEMQCFAPIEQEVEVAADAPAAVWELRLLPFDEIKASAWLPSPPASTPQAASAPPVHKKLKSRGNLPPPTPANTLSGFQRTEVNASAETPKPEAENSSAFSSEMNQASSDGFLINGSVNNGLALPWAQPAAFGNYRKGPRSLYN